MRTLALGLALALASVAAADTLKESLDRADIQSTIATVRPALRACGDKSPTVKGTVKVSVKVAGSGTPTNVVIKETPDPALGACVAAAVQHAKFPASKTGVSFSYPFVF